MKILLFSIAMLATPVSNPDVYGDIYFTKNRSEADYLVFVESHQISADLNVYKTSNACGTGLWNIVNHAIQADYIIYITNNSAEADFSIYYVSNQIFAGEN